MRAIGSKPTAVTWVAVAALLFAVAGTACVDGTTPDCSDAAEHCNPDYDAYPDDSGSEASASDSSSDAAVDTAPTPDSAIDAPHEASSDGGAG